MSSRITLPSFLQDLRLCAALLPLVAARELHACKHVILHSSLHLAACGARAKTDCGHIQSIERETIAVRRVAWLLRIIDAVEPNHRLPGIERLHRLGNVEQHPVGEGTLRRAGVIHDQHKALRVQRRTTPLQSRRLICPVAGAVLRYHSTVLESGTCQSKRLHNVPPFSPCAATRSLRPLPRSGAARSFLSVRDQVNPALLINGSG